MRKMGWKVIHYFECRRCGHMYDGFECAVEPTHEDWVRDKEKASEWDSKLRTICPQCRWEVYHVKSEYDADKYDFPGGPKVPEWGAVPMKKYKGKLEFAYTGD